MLEVSLWLASLEKLREQSHSIELEYEQAKTALERAKEELKALYASSESLSERMHRKDVESEQETMILDWLECKPFTTLFVCGNHENFDRLYSEEFPVVDFHGGKAHKIRENLYHLMRGYVFDLCGKKVFAFGGASSHDIQDGILDPADFESEEEFRKVYKEWYDDYKMFRVNHVSWWEQELPSEEEMQRGAGSLYMHNYDVDFVVSHCLPQSVASMLGFYGSDRLTKYFDSLLDSGLKFKRWYSGHYHICKDIDQYTILYEKIERIV